ncbi:MAG: NADH-quinone oxidoreductase subunit [Frankiaceae bacterium]|nr:NADH-quinone oxidoreductase subunit [Frankiaceae bacterium]
MTEPSAARLSLGDGRAVAVYNVPELSGGLADSSATSATGSATGLASGERPQLATFNAGLACCALEATVATTAATSEADAEVLARMQPYSEGARGAEVLVVSGTVTDAMAPAVRQLYEQLTGPRFVVSYGACSNSGGPYWDSYAVTKGVDQIVPVDVYVPGCPPGPQALLDAVRALPKARAA